jgi:hypothetical protein
MNDEHILKLLDYYEQEICNIPYCGPYLSHLKTMFNPMRAMIYEKQHDKFNRWLGFVQGVLYANGIFSIDQMRNHNRSYKDFIKETKNNG